MTTATVINVHNVHFRDEAVFLLAPSKNEIEPLAASRIPLEKGGKLPRRFMGETKTDFIL